MFCIYVDMYMYMYSDLPHVHGADRHGVRGCALTVLRPPGHYLSHLACHVHGCWCGRWDTGVDNFLVKTVLEKSWIFLPLFCTNPVRDYVAMATTESGEEPAEMAKYPSQ